MENLNIRSCRLHRTLPLCKFLRRSRDPRPRAQGGAIMAPPPPPPSLSSLQNSPVSLGLKITQRDGQFQNMELQHNWWLRHYTDIDRDNKKLSHFGLMPKELYFSKGKYWHNEKYYSFTTTEMSYFIIMVDVQSDLGYRPYRDQRISR